MTSALKILQQSKVLVVLPQPTNLPPVENVQTSIVVIHISYSANFLCYHNAHDCIIA
jgi:hypothetical protein